MCELSYIKISLRAELIFSLTKFCVCVILDAMKIVKRNEYSEENLPSLDEMTSTFSEFSEDDVEFEQRLRAKRNARRRAQRPLSGKEELGLRLFYCGLTAREAARRAGLRDVALFQCINTEQGQELKKRVHEELEDTFRSLESRVHTVLKEALESPNAQIALAGASLWLRSVKERTVKVELTAEDIVRKLVEERSS